MTIKEILSKVADRDKRISDIAEKIKAVEAEISDLDRQKETSVKSGSAGQAVEIMKARRDKEDELQILCQVRDNIKSTPGVSQSDIQAAWSGICDEVMAEYKGKVLPEVKEAYDRYCQAAEKVVALRQKAQAPAAQLEHIAKSQGLDMKLPSPFIGAEINKYRANKGIMAKLNCLDNGIMNTPIAQPLTFD